MDQTQAQPFQELSSLAPRAFDPLYQPTGDASLDRLAFIHVLEKLKTQKRTGWVNQNISGSESIADHMYRMAVLAMLSSDTKLDISKCVMMCLVHDLAEAHVGDITPGENISKAEKAKRESDAMHNFVYDMLHGTPAALRILALWTEYEERETPEAKFVKDLDRFELAAQASEYERCGAKTLQPFFDGSLPELEHPEVQSWGEALSEERQRSQSNASD
ncbi:HD domain-containing protein [Lyophyllum atratum]|nr:HD domain-containing protein [Lyophyllum atratum]